MTTDDAEEGDTYCGDTDGKRVTRFFMYNDLRGRLGQCEPGGLAVVLAGPTAADVAILELLGWPRGKILVVDRSMARVRTATEKYPGVRWFHGELIDAIRGCGRCSIGFANLDLQGVMGEAVPIVAELKDRLRLGAVTWVTYLRGREGINEPLLLARDVAKWIGITKEGDARLEPERLSYGWVLSLSMQDSHHRWLDVPLRRQRYWSNSSPMCVQMLKRVPGQAALVIGHGGVNNLKKYAGGLVGCSEEDRGLRVLRRAIQGLMADYFQDGEVADTPREVALNLRRAGYDARFVAACLALSVAQIAAWWAVDTRARPPNPD